MNSPDNKFANGVILHAIVFNVLAFHFFVPNIVPNTLVKKILSSIQITIIVEDRDFVTVLSVQFFDKGSLLAQRIDFSAKIINLD